MDSREHSEMPPAPSYPSPNAAQIAQGTVSYYANQRHLTADELHLSAELSREVSAANVNDGGANGLPHGQGMVLGASNPSAVDVNRAESAEQHAQHQESQQNQPPQQQQQQQTQPQSQQQPQPQPQQPQQGQSQQPQQQQQPQTPQHMLQFTPNQQVGMDPNHDLSYGDQSARRKRSKVSRACDECRRKKVRCDATSEAGVETCSNCRRTGATCEFSRVPMKRGPSKGYIKELADRINSLESQMQPTVPQSQAEMHYQTIDGDASSNREYQEFSPSIDNQGVSRKRTLSMSEGLQNTFMQPPFPQETRPAAVGGWPVQTPVKDAGHANDLAALDSFAGPSAANGAPKVVQPFWSQEASEISQQARTDVELRDDLPPPVPIDEQVFEAYYRHIHPVFPILPISRARVLSILQLAERPVQETFLHALYAATGASLSRAQNELQAIPTFEKAQDCLYDSFRENSQNRSLSANFVLLHTLILMILDADSRGPENLRGQNGIPKSILVEATFTLVYQIANMLGQTKTSNPEDKNPDSDGNLARKNWAVAMILSRWHTVSVASPDFFGFHDVATPEDRQLFGFGTAQLARYTNTLAGINVALFENSVHPSFGRSANHALERSLHSQLNIIRDLELYKPTGSEDELNTMYAESVSQLSFWYITLLSKRHLYTQIPAEILHPAEGIINILHQQSENATPITSPFHYHFLALAVITLLEITDIPELASDAWKSLEKAMQVIHKRERHAALTGEFQNIFTNQSWEACIRGTIESKLAKIRPDQADNARQNAAAPIVGPTEQRSLEHLADLAVGAGGGAGNAQSPPPQSAGEDKDAMAGVSSNAPPLPDMVTPSNSGQKQDTRVCIDFTQLTKKGYLNVFAGL